ncbi:MAG: DUF885 domain-containing protein [Vicinamibacterales bacterium]|nr:DUF885 domain-containing protein [Vicinamibacterales bacterium]
MIASEPLHHFVDDYLSFLYETNPTAATLDGVHQHDDLLENFERGAVESEVQTLAGLARRLAAISTDSLTGVERVERPWIAAHIQGRIHELEKIRTWERNPQLYGELLGASLAGQALFDFAPAEERARRVLSKLRQTPRFIQSARDNIKDPPGIFLKSGLETLRGTLRFIESDLPRAFADVDDLGLLGDLADAQTEAIDALNAYMAYLETDLAPRARASFRLGGDRFAAKLRFEEGIELPLDRLLEIGLRELGEVQQEFRAAAGRVERGDPRDVWRSVKQRHAPADGIVSAAREQLAQLATFIARRDLVTLPQGESVTVAPTPDFFRWSFASMWTPGPFEARATRAYYYLTDVDPAWAADRKQEYLRDLNTPTLWSISMHEVYPGHFLHFQHLRHVESKARKSLMLASAALVEGWAHYCEHMMIEAGFEKQDPTVRLGQLAEALIRIARLVVAIRLHAEDMSVEQGVRFFRDEAYLEESTARREAERGTFDPGYAVYTAGKLMLLKLREDCKAQAGSAFSLKAFHETLLGNGLATFHVHRQLMLKDGGGAVIE